MIFIRIVMILGVSVLIYFTSPEAAHALGMAKVTVKVVDEEGKPVDAAQIELCFQGGCTNKNVINGVTDEKGIFIASGSSGAGVLSGSVEKKGYYYSIFHNDFINWKLGVWQPWNKEMKVVLRPKIKPVPMYFRDKWVTIPVVGKKVGFDLEKFDWVAPHGLGTVADFVFLLDSRYKSFDERDSNFTITFSNRFDGIQSFELDMGGDFGVGSLFRTPRYAPESGYQNKLVTRYSSKSLPVYRTKDSYSFFRIRSEVDKNGKLKRAMYGKMKGDLEAVSSKDGLAEIELFYWLNPDYTNNLEYDTDRNLFSPLPKGETDKRIP